MNPALPRAPADLAALLDSAAQLRAAARTGSSHRPLRGKNLALLTPSAEQPAARAVLQAAQALGAQAVPVQLGSLPPLDAPSFAETLALLGRLYDGVVTEGVPADLVRQLDKLVDRPLLDQAYGTARGLATSDDELDGLLQALLLQALA